MSESRPNHPRQLAIAAIAAFSTYFCMYAFRKPFTAGVYEGGEVYGLQLKSTLVVAQLLGYMISKFIGIKVVSEMPAKYRAVSIIGLILLAELALVGFAYSPTPLKVVMLFLNGLPLGIIFGLVLAYLEGRKQTEALSAALCASFIISSGVVKSVGRWLIEEMHVSEFQMPMLTGLIFFPGLLISVWMLQATPPPDEDDKRLRAERKQMTRKERLEFFQHYWLGLSLLLLVYISLTVIRTIRDDYGVEIWTAMGVSQKPLIFARSETVVAVLVTGLNALAILVANNMAAIRATIWMMCGGFAIVTGSAFLQSNGSLGPFAFMVTCGVGLYIPYVAFHTTVFERLVAASKRPGNLGFLMYLADTVGYLGYAVVLVMKSTNSTPVAILPFFRYSLIVVSTTSMLALVAALLYFQRSLATDNAEQLLTPGSPAPLDEIPLVE